MDENVTYRGELKKIKKKYGEEMMTLCRQLFPTLLEEGKLFSLLEENLALSKSIAADIKKSNLQDEFTAWIYSLANPPEPIQLPDTGKSPKALLSEVGYDLYECQSEKDIQSFMKYYARDELLHVLTIHGGIRNIMIKNIE